MAASREAALALVALLGWLSALASPVAAKGLGEWPLCEASAAARDPSSNRRVLVADNEHSGDLFAFELSERGLDGMQRLAMPGGAGLRDIEALATQGERLLVVASHSRNKECEFKTKRWQLRWLRARAGHELEEEATIDTSALRASIGSGVTDCVAALFGPVAPRGARALCRALSKGERAPDRAKCGALNIEGAVAVPEPDGPNDASRIWLGLRNPLVAGRAVLLRMASDSRMLRFDAVASIDLGGRGLRELAFSEGTLWGIAGPTADAIEPFSLFAIRGSALAPGAKLAAPVRQRQIPPFSEGLVIDGARAIVVTDGEIGDPTRESCEKGSSQRSVVLP